MFWKGSPCQTCDHSVVTPSLSKHVTSVMYAERDRKHWSKYRWELVLITTGSKRLSQKTVKCFFVFVLNQTQVMFNSANSVWHHIYPTCFTARGVLVRWLTLSNHSETYVGFIVSLFWIKFLYSTHVDFSWQQRRIRHHKALEVDIMNHFADYKAALIQIFIITQLCIFPQLTTLVAT